MQNVSIQTIPVQDLEFWIDNPRIAYSNLTWESPERDIINYYFDEVDALIIARAITAVGVSPIEPILGFKNYSNKYVCEGGRRIAALKALADPTLINNTETRAILQSFIDEKNENISYDKAYVMVFEHASVFTAQAQDRFQQEMFAEEEFGEA